MTGRNGSLTELVLTPPPSGRGPLRHPFETPPEIGRTVEVAPGVLWLRMPLPFALDHINLWLLEDGAGWTIVDTGIRGEKTQALWEEVFAGPLGGRPVTRIIVTHYHPDHVGQAGWLETRWGVPIHMTRTEFLYGRMLSLQRWEDGPPEEACAFYVKAGFDEAMLENYRARNRGGFAAGIEPMPLGHRRLREGDLLAIGGREWRVLIGSGHSPEHACLFSEEHNLIISGDQILPAISSNVSIYPTEPEADPLSEWIASCGKLQAMLPEDVLVLPAHQTPFYGARTRLNQLIESHEKALRRLEKLIRERGPIRAVDAFPALFRRDIGDGLRGLAIGETLAHLNCLIARGLVRRAEEDGVWRYGIAS